MARDLPQGQIRPAAQPLSSFLEPTRRPVAEPARPLEIPRVPELRLIQQGSPGDVRGFNQFEQMVQALAPFNQSLTQLAGTGMAMYADDQVQRGRNEALRAKALLDAQQQQSAEEYAAENRDLARVDPIGALMMDSVNPFRRGGRLRALTELATLEAKGAVISEYRSSEDSPEQWQEGDPRLAKLKVKAINGLRSKYKIDENSPGFAQVIAQANEGADRVTEMQWQDRQNYLKSTVPGTVAAEVYGLYADAVNQGSIEVFLPDGAAQTIKAGDPQWDAARAARMTRIMDARVREMGIPGEATSVKLKAIDELLARANADGDDDLIRLIDKYIRIGPRTESGGRAAVGEFAPTAIFDSEIKYGELRYKREQRAREQLASTYQDQVILGTNRMPDGPERLAALDKLRASPEFQGLSLNQKLELEQKTSKTIDEVTALGRSVEPASALLLDMSSRYGTAWNTSEADAEFERAVAQAPEDDKPALRRQYADLRERNNRREAAPTTREMNAVIDGKIRATLRANYPGTTTEAALRNGNIEAVIAGLTDANAKESARRQYSAYQGYVRSKVAAEEAKKGRPLTTAEATVISTQAVDEYGKSDQKQRAYLFPGVDGQPGIQGLQTSPPPGAAPTPGGGAGPAARPSPPGTKPFSGKVYPSGQLDNIPDRASRVSSWRQVPVLDAPSVVQEAQRVLAGGSPSAALRRFARDAGISPGELLNKQLDFYPGRIEISPAERQKLQRDGRQAQATSNSARNVAMDLPGPVQRLQRGLFDTLMGVSPAVASTRLSAGIGGMQQPVATLAPAPVAPLRSPVLSKLASGRLYTPPRSGLCTTTVLETMQLNGIPNPPGTGGDPDNNPRGLASQLVGKYGWRPLPGLGRPRTINSPYGAFGVNQMTIGEYQAAARAGRVPDGALVFQTMRDWSGNAKGSRGFDAAIARNGGMNLWNGTVTNGRGALIGPSVYGSATTQVFVLVPGDSAGGGRTARR